MVTLENIIQYIETRAALNPDLAGHVKAVRPREPVPQFKDYGLRIYFNDQDYVANHREKLGPVLTQRYRINLDLVFNRQLTDRKVWSDAKGISYWTMAISLLFANQTNGGLFRDSYWTPNAAMEQDDSATIIRGILHITVDTVYDSNNQVI